MFGLHESELLDHIKCMAVKTLSIIVSRVEMHEMKQEPHEDVHHFAARLRGQAEVCDFHASCDAPHCTARPSYADEEIKTQLCIGICDPEIQQQLLMTDVDKQSLDKVIQFIALKETGRMSHSSLRNTATLTPSAASGIEKIYTYKQHKRVPEDTTSDTAECDWCGQRGHGQRSPQDVRRDRCPAFQHRCKNCGKLGHF